MADTSMFFNIFGRDMGVGSMFEGVAAKGHNVTGSLAGIGAAAAGIGFVKLGMDAVKSFDEVAAATFKLQTETGATAEDASRLDAVLAGSGLTADGTAKSFGIFSKQLVAGTQSASAHADMVKRLGFDYLDANGHILPLTEILPKLSDTFQSMPDGPEKTAIALKLFGKTGADLIPMLDKGGASMDMFKAQADALGTTIGQEQVNDFRAGQAAGRQWDQAMLGLGVTVGSVLSPIIVGLTQMMNSTLIPALRGLEQWFRTLPGPIQQFAMILVVVLGVGGPLVVMIASFGGAIMTLIPIVTAIGSALSALWVILMANPIFLVIGMIAVFVASLVYAYNNVGWFKDFVNAAFQVIGNVISTVISFITGTLIPLLVNGWQNAANQAQVVGAVIAVVWNMVSSTVANMVSSVSGFLGSLAGTISGIWNGIVSNTSSMIGNVVGFFSGLPGRILGAIGNLGGLLVNIGSQLIGGLISGIQGALGGLGDVLGSVTNFIASHKGPEEVDRALLIPHGGWVIGGLIKGIQNSLPGLSGVLGGVTDMITKTVNGPSFSVSGGAAAVSAAGAVPGRQAPPTPQPVKLDLHGYTIALNSDATMGTFKKIADGSAISAVNSANDDIYRGRAR